MIIFGLDNVLADCEHRRHWVDPEKNDDYEFIKYHAVGNTLFRDQWWHKNEMLLSHPPQRKQFHPNWKSYHEDCVDDKVIGPTMNTFGRYWCGQKSLHTEIWTDRDESLIEKTLNWFISNQFFGLFDHQINALRKTIRMRPIGCNLPKHKLFEMWLEDTYEDTKWGRRSPIDMVFESDPQAIAMFRNEGVFVFDCNQGR